jgi:hypothetical protein
MPSAPEGQHPIATKSTETDEPKAHAMNSRKGSSPAWAETSGLGRGLEPGRRQPLRPITSVFPYLGWGQSNARNQRYGTLLLLCRLR